MIADNQSRNISLTHAAVAAVFILCSIRFFWLIDRFAVNLFTWDQWGFNDATVFEQHSLWQIFRWQWGPHRLGVGGVVAKVLEPLISWNTRYEAFAVGTVILIASLLALLLKKRLFGNVDLADAIIPLLFLTPIQYEVLTQSGTPSHGPIPLLLMVIYCLAWTIESVTLRYAAVLTTNFLLIYTGFGVFIGVITPVLLCVELLKSPSARKKTLVVLPLALLSLASFFVGYHRQAAMACPMPDQQNGLNHLWFMDVMFATFVGIKASKTLGFALLVGGVLLISAALCMLFLSRRLLLRKSEHWTATLIALAMVSYALLFSLGTSLGRLCFGLGGAEASRYMTYLVLAFFGLYLAASSMQNARWKLIYTVLLAILAVMTSVGLRPNDYASMNDYAHRKTAWKTCYLATHDIDACTVATEFHVFPRLDNSFIDETRLQQKLTFLRTNRLNLYSDAPCITEKMKTAFRLKMEQCAPSN